MRRAFTAIFITLRLCSVPSEVSCLCPDLQLHPNIPVKRRIKSLKLRTLSLLANLLSKGELNMKATGIVRRIDDLGRVVIPKEIRRTMRIREGDPSLMTLRWMLSLIEVGTVGRGV